MKTKDTTAIGMLLAAVYFVSLMFASLPVPAQAIWNANFDAQPLGPLGTEPASDPMPLGLPDFIIRDNASCRADVVSSAVNLTNKPVDIHGHALGLTSLEFANPSLIEFFQWRVSFDWVALTANNDTQPEQNQFSIVANSEEDGYVVSFGLKFDTTGHYQVQDGLGFHQISTFTQGVSDHIDLVFEPNGGYTLAINGVQQSSGPMIYQNFYSTVFDSNGRFIAFAPVEFAVDNFVVVEYVTPLPKLAIQPLVAGASNVNLTLSGTPNSVWAIERAAALPGTWTNLGQVTIPPSGSGPFQDPSPPKPAAFYRARR